MSNIYRVRRTMLGKCVLQKYVDAGEGSPETGFYDMRYGSQIGEFTVVRLSEIEGLRRRVELADKRAEQSRQSRKRRRDFEASRMPS